MTNLSDAVRSVLISAPEVGPPLPLFRGAILFQQDQIADKLYLIESGLVKLTRTSDNGGQQILSVLGPNQLVGEECLAERPSTHQAEAECMTNGSLFVIPVTAIRRMFSVPEIAVSLMGYTLGRDVQLIRKLELLAHHDVEHRILLSLAHLSQLVKPQSDGAAYPIPMTQAELASFVGATRETTSTTLSHLQSRKLVTLARRLVTTVHPDLLISAANNRLANGRGA